jgi:putative DNA primase/helicase
MNDAVEGLAAARAEMRKKGGALSAMSEDALALRFSAQNPDLRYIAAWHRWMRWDGTRWAEDSTLHAFDLARDLCREAARKANEGGKGIASGHTVAAVVSLARTDRCHAATTDMWDTDPWLLNTPAGTIDLRTGSLGKVSPEAYITRCTAVASGDGCPMWLGFLDRITNGDTRLQAFLQRMCGYALTGLTRDHALFFLYGLGANGKTVFLSTVTGILADYHRVAPIEMLLASKQERHPTELAGLTGCRLVTASETEQGKRWAEAKIKTLSGGDRIAARFMRGDFFEFVPQFKLIIAGNHKPGLNCVDEAIRRRFHLVPFTVTIPVAERDPELSNKLKAEWPAVLSWMIEGCLEWQKVGLAPPESVTSATAAYLEDQDVVKNWLAECTAEDPVTETRVSILFQSWKNWCVENGEYPGSSKAFSQRLMDLALRHRHTNKGNVFRGVRVTA